MSILMSSSTHEQQSPVKDSELHAVEEYIRSALECTATAPPPPPPPPLFSTPELNYLQQQQPRLNSAASSTGAANVFGKELFPAAHDEEEADDSSDDSDNSGMPGEGQRRFLNQTAGFIVGGVVATIAYLAFKESPYADVLRRYTS